MSDLILINVTGRSVNAKYLPAQDPTAGWTGELQAQFTFDASWAGASKTAVFTAGEVSVPVQLADMTVDVPPEVLAVEGETLMVGVVGVWNENTTRPTEVVPVVDITSGAYIPAEWRPTTPELYTQLLAAVAGHVRTVDGITPDQSGNVDLPPFPFLCSIGGATCKNIYDAYGRGELVYGVDDNGGIYPLIQRPSLTSATFGGYNPVSRQATYWAAQIDDNETVWITGSDSWERSYVLNNSSKLATCKAVYDELTKYYDKTFIDNAIAAAKAEAAQALSSHNADPLAHPAIRQTITELANRLNALADSDDATLDQLSEIVAYIKSNKDLIDTVTTSKVSVSDIVNSLTSTATNKPLSAAQGAVLKAAVDALEAEVEASKVLVLDADNLPDNAFVLVSEAYNARRLCCLRYSRAGYLFLQSKVYGEDYYTFSAIDKDSKLVKLKLYSNDTLSDPEDSDISNVFVGDDDTTYIQWRHRIDAGQSCVWRSSEHFGFDYTYIGMYSSGTLFFSAIDHNLAFALEISPSGTKSLIKYTIPHTPSPSEAGYVWTATSTGTADWLPPTGGSGGDSNTVVFDEDNVTLEAIVEAHEADKAVFFIGGLNGGDINQYSLIDVAEGGASFASQPRRSVEGEIASIDWAEVAPDNTVAYGSYSLPTETNLRESLNSISVLSVLVFAISDGTPFIALQPPGDTDAVPVTHEQLQGILLQRATILIHMEALQIYRFDKIDTTTQAIVFSRTDGNTTSTITMAADNTVTVAESEVIPTPTGSDNGKALVAQDGAAVWKEIAGGGGGASANWELIGEMVSDGTADITGLTIPIDFSAYRQIFAFAYNLPAETKLRLIARSQLVWSNGVFLGYNGLGADSTALGAYQNGKMAQLWALSGIAVNIGNQVITYGAGEARYNSGSATWRQGAQEAVLPRVTWDQLKYISLDRNSNTDIVPAGAAFKVWGVK